MAKKEKDEAPEVETPRALKTPHKTAAEVQQEKQDLAQKLHDEAPEVVFVDSDGKEYPGKMIPLPLTKGVVIDVPQVTNPAEEYQKLARLPLEKQAEAFAELSKRMSVPAKALSINGSIIRLGSITDPSGKEHLCKTTEVNGKLVAAPDLTIDHGEKRGFISKHFVRHEKNVARAPQGEKQIPFFRFALIILALLFGGSAFAVDSGAVSTGVQTFDGRKNWLMFSPVSTTASGTITLNKNSGSIQRIDCNGAGRTVILPPESSSKGWVLRIINTTSAAYTLTVRNSANDATIASVTQYQTADFYCDGTTWTSAVYTSATTGFVAADGSTTGGTAQTQVFTNGVTTDAIIGNTTGTTFAYAGKVGSSSAGQVLTFTAGAGNGAFDGGSALVKGGASGAGATGAGGAATIQGGAAGSTNGAGGAVAVTAGAGVGSGAGGANTQVGGAGGATGAGGDWTATGGRGGSTSGAAGVWTGTAGAGGAGTTTTGGIAKIVGGGSGTGATGNGGAAQVTGGAALSTAGNGGAVTITGGVGTTTGTSGGVTIISGADGAGGTVGNISIDTGVATGTAGTIGIGATNSGAMTVGRTGQTVTFPGTVSLTVTPTGEGITRWVVVALTNAQMLDLADTPVELIAAPGAGKMIEVVSAVFLFDYTAVYTVTAGDDLCINYENEAGMTVATGEATGFVDQTADCALIVNRAANVVPTKTVSENKAIILCNEGTDFGGGNASNAVRVKLAYRVWTTGF